MSRAGFHQTWCLELRLNWVWGSFMCLLQIPSMFSCVFTEERIEFGHTDIKPRSVDCCRDVCSSVGFSHLHIWSWSSTRVTISFFVTTRNQSPTDQLLSLASSRKSPGCFKLLLLWIMATRFCESSAQQNVFLNSSPDLWLDTILFLSSTGIFFFYLRAYFYYFFAIKTFIKAYVPFQIIPIQLNLQQVNFTQSVVTSTRNMNAPELNFKCPRKRVWLLMQWNHLLNFLYIC